MKVIHVSPIYFEQDAVIGGGERYPLELAKAMAEVTPTELISFSERPRIEQLGALTVRLFKPWFYISGQKVSPVCPTFLNALRGSDVIHAYQFHTLTTSLAVLFGKLRKKKLL